MRPASAQPRWPSRPNWPPGRCAAVPVTGVDLTRRLRAVWTEGRRLIPGPALDLYAIAARSARPLTGLCGSRSGRAGLHRKALPCRSTGHSPGSGMCVRVDEEVLVGGPAQETAAAGDRSLRVVIPGRPPSMAERMSEGAWAAAHRVSSTSRARRPAASRRGREPPRRIERAPPETDRSAPTVLVSPSPTRVNAQGARIWPLTTRSRVARPRTSKSTWLDISSKRSPDGNRRTR